MHFNVIHFILQNKTFLHFIFLCQNKWPLLHQVALCVTEKMYRALAMTKGCGFVSVLLNHVVYFFRIVSIVATLTIQNTQSQSAKIFVKEKVKTRNSKQGCK